MREVQAEFQRGLLDGCDPDRDVLVFAAHLYVEGAGPSYTERPVDISDTYLTEADALPQVSYAALGHIHRPQAVARGGMAARYAGSPLQLDFGEAGEDKSVVVVDADPGRPVRVELVPLRAGRRLADFTGTLEELRASRPGSATRSSGRSSSARNPSPISPPRRRTPRRRQRSCPIEPRCAASQVAVLERADAEGREPDLPDLFREYLTGRVPAGAVAADILESFTALLADAGSEVPGIFGEEARLGGPRRRARPASASGESSSPAQEHARSASPVPRGAGMRPLQLSFSGIRSYPGAVGPLDFTGKTLIGIVGDTGAGQVHHPGSDQPRAVRQLHLDRPASTRRSWPRAPPR